MASPRGTYVITFDRTAEAECLIWENQQATLNNLTVMLQMTDSSANNVPQSADNEQYVHILGGT